MSPTLRIAELPPSQFSAFAAYMASHLADNGEGSTPLFQPLAREDCRFDGARAEAFRQALCVAWPVAGWRRAWVAMTAHDAIVGHVDLRGHAMPYTGHRCLLGMGVDRQHRGAGLGRRLLDTAVHWAAGQAGLDWIDLEVISANAPALKLYLSAGFVETGHRPDLFRFDGRSVGYQAMALRLPAA